MKIYPLQEGLYSIDKNHELNKINDKKENIKNASLIIGINPCIVITNTDIILFDTGLGRKNENDILDIWFNLFQYNISIYDVTKVVISHLHHDHIKGIASKTNYNNYELNFPNANYYLSKNNLIDILNSDAEIEIKEKLLFITNETNCINFFEDFDNKINSQLFFEETNAHCKNHYVFWIKENNEIIFYGADDAPQLIQMQRKFVTKYDYNPNKCADLRKKWWEEGEKEKWTFIFYHDVINPIFNF